MTNPPSAALLAAQKAVHDAMVTFVDTTLRPLMQTTKDLARSEASQQWNDADDGALFLAAFLFSRRMIFRGEIPGPPLPYVQGGGWVDEWQNGINRGIANPLPRSRADSN